MERGQGYRSGDWLATCDRCAGTYYASALRQEWTGLRVCRECLDVRHPQEFVRGVPDRQAPPWVRPVPPVREISVTLTTEDGIAILDEDGQPVQTEGVTVTL